MGMAASQARYLALLARKSNCEYEGQQINQSRLALSNQSADLFSQMMALQVPLTPSKSDFTVLKYSFTDGVTQFKIDKWNRLSDSDGDGYNYSVTYHYDTGVYTGYQRYKQNPQILFSGVAPTISTDPEEEIKKIQNALVELEKAKANMDLKEAAYLSQKQQAAKLSNYKDLTTLDNITSCTYQLVDAKKTCTVTTKDGEDPEKEYTLTNYNDLNATDKDNVKAYVNKLKEYGAFDDTLDWSKIYYYKKTETVTTETGTEEKILEDFIAFKDDLDAAQAKTSTMVPAFHVVSEVPVGAGYVSMKQMDDAVQKALEEYNTAKAAYKTAEEVYEKCDVPSKTGNIKLTPLASLNEDQLKAINQILADMKEQEIDTNITKCFDTLQEEYTKDTYKGGLYSFEMVGKTYYTTYYDLYNSVINGTGVNSIDDQAKLPYYTANDIEKAITNTKRALIEKDESGRFANLHLEDDSIIYELKSITETDELAYEDAMNEYTYKRSLYDKQVSDINAKTSIIQRQDQNLELRLKQLDTEQNALNTEIEAVSKVVKDNIEKSFKTFSG